MTAAEPGGDATRALSADEVIHFRRSIRRFLPTPVDAGIVREILDLAARAPSGSNVQPWKVYALAGAEKEALSQAVTEKYSRSGIDAEVEYYPKPWAEPWLSRRRRFAADLHALLGIAEDDEEGSTRQSIRNYRFFDAPVGLIFTVDRAFGSGMLLDYGMFLQTLMLAARARGLDTCPQLAFARFQDTVRRSLGLPESERVVCGMALGHADPDAPENRLRTERVPAGAFTDFRGFD
ncbi:MAG: nitroreductase [Candidatus Accumulibacter sp.]|jgi:nitroreductase|nr:nitroreductase [Accumulibacter sp.]